MISYDEAWEVAKARRKTPSISRFEVNMPEADLDTLEGVIEAWIDSGIAAKICDEHASCVAFRGKYDERGITADQYGGSTPNLYKESYFERTAYDMHEEISAVVSQEMRDNESWLKEHLARTLRYDILPQYEASGYDVWVEDIYDGYFEFGIGGYSPWGENEERYRCEEWPGWAEPSSGSSEYFVTGDAYEQEQQRKMERLWGSRR